MKTSKTPLSDQDKLNQQNAVAFILVLVFLLSLTAAYGFGAAVLGCLLTVSALALGAGIREGQSIKVIQETISPEIEKIGNAVNPLLEELKAKQNKKDKLQ